METGRATQPVAETTWPSKRVYAMAAICLLVGTAIGYLLHISQPPIPPPSPANEARVQINTPLNNSQPNSTSSTLRGHMPSLDEMKQLADKKAMPLLEKLKSDSNNIELLNQVGYIYQSAHQFKLAADYYSKALQVKPKNVAIRTEMATCLYYSGDVDGALGQLQQALNYDPNNANSLFNLGMIKWRGKHDNKGAEMAWKQLLKTNPQLSAERKADVQKRLDEVRMQNKN